MSTHNIYFCAEIRKLSLLFLVIKSALSGRIKMFYLEVYTMRKFISGICFSSTHLPCMLSKQ